VAVSVGVVMWRIFGDHGIFLESVREMADQEGAEPTHSADVVPFWRKVHEALKTAADDFVMFSVFLIGGTAIAAVINSGFSRAAMAPVAEHEVASIAGLMLLAVLLNVCSEADAFIAASFQAFSLPAKLSFIVLGPMLDIKLLLMFLAVFRRRAIVVLSCLIVGLVFVLCVTGHQWIPEFVAALGR